MSRAHITILGNFDPEYAGHVATRDAIIHAERELGVVVNTRWVTPEQLSDPDTALQGTCAALVASRHPRHRRQLYPEVLHSLRWLRDHRVPTLAIEFGYHHMVIELARNVLGHADANSTAFDDATTYPVLSRFDEGSNRPDDLRPGLVDVEILPDTQLATIYAQSGVVRESLRGNFVFNPDFASDFQKAGFGLPARAQRGERMLVAALEWRALPFYIGVAYLPQFASRAGRSHPLIRALVAAGIAHT